MPAPTIDVALLTDARYEQPENPDWYVSQILEEDELLQAALGRRGLHAVRVDWARSDFAWSSARCALFRTTWDYFHRAGEFLAWLDRASGETRLINPPAVIRWNIDKHYLADLRDRGVHTVPTYFVETGSSISLPAALDETGWEEAVLKPVISGAARHTYRVSADNAREHDAVFRELLSAEAVMLQPFQRAIVDTGELSLMVIGGEYTHAVRKVAQPQDFRVQDDHGGSVHPYTPQPDEIRFAEHAVRACNPPPVYARVDMLRDNDGELAVMELELVEPELFMRLHPPAAEALAGQVADVLEASSRNAR
ncbi:MAG: ATP-grasp domain-containing protein [Planctomycetota bacterium]|jgi:glutathione synthase/RimK-type ligase-like ATP-grasp enzyme